MCLTWNIAQSPVDGLTAYVKGMYVIYELIIEEWYINPLN
jgi:hypothetical protein